MVDANGTLLSIPTHLTCNVFLLTVQMHQVFHLKMALITKLQAEESVDLDIKIMVLK